MSSARARPRSLAAAVEERFLIPAYASGWAPLAIAAHRGLALALQLRGPARRRTAVLGAGSIRVLEIGRGKVTEAISGPLLGPLSEPEDVGVRPLLAPADSPGAADLVVAEVHRWLAPRFRDAGWLIVPTDVRWQGDLATVPPRFTSRSLKSDLNKVRTGGFTMEHTTAREAWDEFEATMLRPQALARFGADAWMPSAGFLRRLARRGVLHLVSLGGRRVSGACSVRHGDRVWVPLSGIRAGDPELLKAGAGVAALVLTLDWARSEGCRRLDAGRTSGFLNDGVARSKRKWGLEPVADPLVAVAALWIGSPAARAAFARTPVLVETAAGLEPYAGGPA